MPFGAVLLKPGVQTQETMSLNEAGVSQAQLIRYKDGLIQTYGGWQQYVTFTIGSTIRELHAWQDSAGGKHLGVGATQSLNVVTAGSNTVITPQTTTTNSSQITLACSSASNNTTITIFDPASSGTASIYDTIFFNTQIAIGNLLLTGAYKIASILSSNTYTITSSIAATTTVSSSGILAVFDSTANSPVITVTLPNNGYQSIVGLFYPFIAATSIAGQTIQGSYQITSVIDTTSFTITLNAQTSATATATMNNSKKQIVYYVTQGPAATGFGFGAGGFGTNGFGGTGSGTVAVGGTPITATDWTMDNWGEVLLACPKDGPIYTWSPASGFSNTQVISQAPFFNGGIFISMPQQILVAWRSCQTTGVQDPLLVRWSDDGDFTNWTASNATSAGSFHLPTGSIIMGGIQAQTQGVIWTDIEVWLMTYVGGDAIFNFNRVGTGCGLIGPHAGNSISGTVYWCGINNFFVMSAQGVQALPCSVWDVIFQNLNTSYQARVYCAVNSAFNEVAWFYPSAVSTGENDSYVKYNVTEKEWDYGALQRTAWIDVSVLGQPIGGDAQGLLYQHETGTIISGVNAPSFQTGWWAITEGNDLSFVDFVIPDFKWGLYSGASDAQVSITFFAADYPGDTPRVYGPYTVTQSTEYIPVRLRGRLMSALIQSASQSFWRLGRLRFRFAASGRR